MGDFSLYKKLHPDCQDNIVVLTVLSSLKRARTVGECLFWKFFILTAEIKSDLGGGGCNTYQTAIVCKYHTKRNFPPKLHDMYIMQPRSQGFSIFVIGKAGKGPGTGRSHDFQHPDIVGVINYNNNELENTRWPPTQECPQNLSA